MTRKRHQLKARKLSSTPASCVRGGGPSPHQRPPSTSDLDSAAPKTMLSENCGGDDGNSATQQPPRPCVDDIVPKAVTTTPSTNCGSDGRASDTQKLKWRWADDSESDSPHPAPFDSTLFERNASSCGGSAEGDVTHAENSDDMLQHATGSAEKTNLEHVKEPSILQELTEDESEEFVESFRFLPCYTDEHGYAVPFPETDSVGVSKDTVVENNGRVCGGEAAVAGEAFGFFRMDEDDSGDEEDGFGPSIEQIMEQQWGNVRTEHDEEEDIRIALETLRNTAHGSSCGSDCGVVHEAVALCTDLDDTETGVCPKSSDHDVDDNLHETTEQIDFGDHAIADMYGGLGDKEPRVLAPVDHAVDGFGSSEEFGFQRVEGKRKRKKKKKLYETFAQLDGVADEEATAADMEDQSAEAASSGKAVNWDGHAASELVGLSWRWDGVSSSQWWDNDEWESWRDKSVAESHRWESHQSPQEGDAGDAGTHEYSKAAHENAKRGLGGKQLEDLTCSSTARTRAAGILAEVEFERAKDLWQAKRNSPQAQIKLKIAYEEIKGRYMKLLRSEVKSLQRVCRQLDLQPGS
eukprot:TRINITY_DN20901_c0_g1_i1.p1 TRINITY_DN20901_c0_g1~~TRINITY_DN20901_c0_g1_i1.p1  ORF type:complete len:578 (-),score=116.51 TRINITY_DN20901_c0_g1_i1:160-1893(-)